MYRFDQVKLIIWDLDDTLWNGTLSEGEVSLPAEHRAPIYYKVRSGVRWWIR